MTIYAIDATGANPANLVTGEVIPANKRTLETNGYFTVASGPFYSKTMVITHTPLTGPSRVLVNGEDYHGVFQFVAATTDTENPVFGAIGIVTTGLTGSFSLSYQAFGGNWIIETISMNEFLNTNIFNPNTSILALKPKYPLYLPGDTFATELLTVANLQAVQVLAPVVLNLEIRYVSALDDGNNNTLGPAVDGAVLVFDTMTDSWKGTLAPRKLVFDQGDF